MFKKYLLLLPIITVMFLGSGYADGCCVKGSCACVKGGCCKDGKCACKGGCCTKGSCACAEGKCNAKCGCQRG